MNIKIIGVDSKNGTRLLKNIERLSKELKQKFNIAKIPSRDREKYGIRIVPTLIIDDNVVSMGSVLSEREIKVLLKGMV